LGILNTSIPFVLSHGSFLTARGLDLLRSCNQYISITPESEQHYGHNDPHSHVAQDQGALGVDTHFTFSTDIITQARLWLQRVRVELYSRVLRDWHVPYNNPMSVAQAFHMATRAGGLALRRPDIGVVAAGAVADLLVFDGTAPSLLGWRDPVAAVILHASVGDIEGVMANGVWVKRNGSLVVDGYDGVRARFLDAAHRVQETWRNIAYPALPDNMFSYPYGKTLQVDTERGSGDGYGQTYV
jgi:cytosine/adenosine deaminase-related metal-dependent hydrolase